MINWHSFFFLFFSLITCGFALAVLFTSNIVRMAFYLTLCLGAASGLFFLAGAEFIGAMQFMIYVGGTLVLLIFGVMLTAQQRFITMETGAAEWVLASIVGGSMLVLLVGAGFSVKEWRKGPSADHVVTIADSKTSSPIGLALSGVRVDKLEEQNPVLRDGLSGYLLPFVIVSMHLLVVLVGAGYMARTKRRPGPETRVVPAADNRRFSFAVQAGLWKGMLINAVLAVLCFSGLASRFAATGEEATTVQQIFASIAALPPWLLPTLGLLFALNVLLLYVVYSWQKWGVVGLVIVPLVQTYCLTTVAVAWWVVPVFFVLAILPVIALIVLLCSGRPSFWSQME